jgi:hypothetical protein
MPGREPGIPLFRHKHQKTKAGMAGTNPAMTVLKASPATAAGLTSGYQV